MVRQTFKIGLVEVAVLCFEHAAPCFGLIVDLSRGRCLDKSQRTILVSKANLALRISRDLFRDDKRLSEPICPVEKLIAGHQNQVSLRGVLFL